MRSILDEDRGGDKDQEGSTPLVVFAPEIADKRVGDVLTDAPMIGALQARNVPGIYYTKYHMHQNYSSTTASVCCSAVFAVCSLRSLFISIVVVLPYPRVEWKSGVLINGSRSPYGAAVKSLLL